LIAALVQLVRDRWEREGGAPDNVVAFRGRPSKGASVLPHDHQQGRIVK
jgi:hypothetical protein